MSNGVHFQRELRLLPEMDAFLQEYLGVALDETNKKNLDQFIYLEEYDAYYLLHGDTNFQRCTVTSLEQNEDGTYHAHL